MKRLKLDKKITRTYDYYLSTLEHMVEMVYSRHMGPEFIEIMENLVHGQLSNAYEKALEDNGLTIEDATPEMHDEVQEFIESDQEHIQSFYEDIVDCIVEEKPIDEMLSRCELWAARWHDVYNAAMLTINSDLGEKLVWRLGATEKHCSTCEYLDGIVAYAEEWEQSGIRPQNPPNPILDCGGWLCDCELEHTTERRTRNALDILFDVAVIRGIHNKTIRKLTLRVGNENSGNHDHAGRPGEVGGSAPEPHELWLSDTPYMTRVDEIPKYSGKGPGGGEAYMLVPVAGGINSQLYFGEKLGHDGIGFDIVEQNMDVLTTKPSGEENKELREQLEKMGGMTRVQYLIKNEGCIRLDMARDELAIESKFIDKDTLHFLQHELTLNHTTEFPPKIVWSGMAKNSSGEYYPTQLYMDRDEFLDGKYIRWDPNLEDITIRKKLRRKLCLHQTQ